MVASPNEIRYIFVFESLNEFLWSDVHVERKLNKNDMFHLEIFPKCFEDR
jgi:hypothetical protein